MGRKALTLKTKLASALLALGDIPYADAKEMTADQLVSLYQFDHGMLHESEHPQRDEYWNITPRLIKHHRDKTRRDAAIIAKGRRIRRKGQHFLEISAETRKEVGNDVVLTEVMREAYQEGHYAGRQQANKAWSEEASRPGGALRWRKLRSRGFDKRYRRHLDGTVTKR